MKNLHQVVDQMQSEILADIKAGIVPKEVKSFSELHDYVDANCYGGFCDEGSPYSFEVTNDAQNLINVWLIAGGHNV